MRISLIKARSVLSPSRVYEYTINPYRGCSYGCRYCYATFIRRFSRHRERWGDFVDVKINAPEVLAGEVRRKRPSRIWISGVCDPYQPLEADYFITRRCLEILLHHGWKVIIQTKSPLALRDLEILKKRRAQVEICYTITTAYERIREIFEPQAPSIEERIEAVTRWHEEGFTTSVMIAPLLPKAEGLVERLAGRVDYVLVDRMNYHYADTLYRQHKLTWAMENTFFYNAGKLIREGFLKQGVRCEVLFSFPGG